MDTHRSRHAALPAQPAPIAGPAAPPVRWLPIELGGRRRCLRRQRQRRRWLRAPTAAETRPGR